MDPIAQLGWGNQRGEVEGPAAQLVRDVFVVADLMHKDVMSQMGGNISSGDECEVSFDVAAEESDLQSTKRSLDAVGTVDADPQGQ